MIATAKIVKTGNGQTVRLPEAFCLEGDEVWIRKSVATGEIILTPKPARKSLEAFFALLDAEPLPEDFLSESIDSAEEPRNVFEDERA